MITVFGSLNVDYIFQVSQLPAPGETVLASNMQVLPGGKGANQAVAAARAGAKVHGGRRRQGRLEQDRSCRLVRRWRRHQCSRIKHHAYRYRGNQCGRTGRKCDYRILWGQP